MVKILHIGNGNEKHCGARTYDVGRKLQHGLIRSQHDALFFSDRDTARAHGMFGTKWRGRERCNARLLTVAERFRPDMILLGHADIITNATMQAVKDMLPDVRVAQFNVDPLFRPDNDAAIRARLDVVDVSFITTGGTVLERYATPSHAAYYIPNPVDRALERYVCFADDSAYDVFYAVRATTTSGSHEGNDRVEIPRFIQQKAEELRTYFHGFDGVPELFGHGFYDAISQCAMGLNLSHNCTTKGKVVTASSDEKYGYSSDRLAQYMGCGLLTFTQTGFALDTVFRKDEIVFFDEREDLLDKLRFYQRHDLARRAIAERGWRKVHRDHSAQKVADYIVDVTMTGDTRHPVQW